MRAPETSGATMVFSGAGISASPPACLPLGNQLRDAVLHVMFLGARSYAPDLVDEEQFKRMGAPERKLEQVLGRLWRIIGERAMESLRCLAIDVPNESHMYCALHLARGGVHVTVNLDRGVEAAYQLLRQGARAANDGPVRFWLVPRLMARSGRVERRGTSRGCAAGGV
jgi:hypothetical protein